MGALGSGFRMLSLGFRVLGLGSSVPLRMPGSRLWGWRFWAFQGLGSSCLDTGRGSFLSNLVCFASVNPPHHNN